MEGQEWRVQAQVRMERMDREGTNNGRYESQAARTRLDNIEGRLKAVEDEARKIDVMKEKIDRLEGRKPWNLFCVSSSLRSLFVLPRNQGNL